MVNTECKWFFFDTFVLLKSRALPVSYTCILLLHVFKYSYKPCCKRKWIQLLALLYYVRIITRHRQAAFMCQWPSDNTTIWLLEASLRVTCFFVCFVFLYYTQDNHNYTWPPHHIKTRPHTISHGGALFATSALL